jgi:hypothetical protein
VWNPAVSQQTPGAPVFAQASYTLRMYDERGPDTGPTPGRLAPFAQVRFGMYNPLPYTALASG